MKSPDRESRNRIASPSPFATIRERLDRLEWRDLGSAHNSAATLLVEAGVEPLLASLRSNTREIVNPDRSVEKTTHYKWFVAASPADDFEVWLHEYKPDRLRRKGHATVPHNHRFWLTSMILRGGFTDVRYERRADSPSVAPRESHSMRSGDTMVFDAAEVHSLQDIDDETLSLVVQSRPIRHYSEVFEDGEVRRYSDLEAKLADFADSL